MRLLPFLSVLLASASSLPTATAATFTVDTVTLDLGDIDPGDGECAWATFPPVGQRCTLRAAIMEANASPGPDRVIVPFGAEIVLSRPGRNEDSAALGDLDITGPLEVRTASVSDPASSPTIDADGIDRVFDVHFSAGEVHLVNLRITGGAANDATTYVGGGVRSQVPMLHLWYCEVVGNVANAGGGLYVAHSLDVVGSDIHGNVVTDLGFTSPEGSAIRDPDGGTGPTDTVSIRGSTVRTNLALGGDFGSDLSASGAVYLHSNVRALFHESIGKLSRELLRHRSVKQNSAGRFALRKGNRRAEHDQPDHGSHHEAESVSQSSSHMDLVVDVSLLVILPIEHLETSWISAPFPVRPCGPIPR